MNVLVTGITGFAGSHLAELLLRLPTPQINLFGTYLHPETIQSHLGPWVSKITFFPWDVTQPQDIESILQKTEPEIIFHLAGISYVPEAEQDPSLTYRINSLSVHYLLENVAKICSKARIVLISTSEVYGKVSVTEIPLTESHPINPCNVYAVSKVMMEVIAKYKMNAHQLNLMILRSFNHSGPRQSDQFVISNFCRQIARINLGLAEPVLRVGDLEAKRDFTDVRDIVRGYWFAATKGRTGEIYNLCSEKAYSIGQITSMLTEISEESVQVLQDPSRLRKSDLPILLGSYKKFHQDTQWEPLHTLDSTLKETLHYWILREEKLKTAQKS